MKITPLTALETVPSGFTHKVTLKLADLANTTTSTLTKNLLTLSSGCVAIKAGYAIRTELDATSLTQVTLSLGDNGSTTRWVSAADIHNTSKVLYGIATTAIAYTATSTVVATVIGAGTTLDNLSAGEIDFYLQIFDYAQMS